KIPGICNMAAFYQQYAQLASVNESIKSWADLKGKKFATLPRGNTTEVAAQQLLKAAGLTYDDLALVNFASITDQVNMAKDGQVDAILTSRPCRPGAISTSPTRGEPGTSRSATSSSIGSRR